LLSFNVNKNMTFAENLNSHLKLLFQPLSDFHSYRKDYKNYFRVIMNKRSNRYPFNATLRNNKILSIENISQLRITKWASENIFEFKNDLLIIKKADFPEVKLYDWKDNGDIRGVFFDDEYKFLPVKDKIVVDVGANIADTSIYFAHRGAKKIIALEPAPRNYESAKKNILLNNLENKIELLLAGCSNKEGNIQISSKKSGVVYSLEVDEIQDVKVPLLRLKDLIKQYLSEFLVLKMDCEGCEYESILDADCETLRNFSHIQIEYHFGYKNLKEKLENCGFKVNVTPPNIGKRLFQDKQKAFFGYIYAIRKPKNSS